MNKDFKSLDQKFMPLSEAELVEVEGGWVGGDLVRAVFDIGAYGRIRARIGSGSGSSNRGGANNGGAASPDVFN